MDSESKGKRTYQAGPKEGKRRRTARESGRDDNKGRAVQMYRNSQETYFVVRERGEGIKKGQGRRRKRNAKKLG